MKLMGETLWRRRRLAMAEVRESPTAHCDNCGNESTMVRLFSGAWMSPRSWGTMSIGRTHLRLCDICLGAAHDGAIKALKGQGT
jgi:hypothetical protein